MILDKLIRKRLIRTKTSPSSKSLPVKPKQKLITAPKVITTPNASTPSLNRPVTPRTPQPKYRLMLCDESLPQSTTDEVFSPNLRKSKNNETKCALCRVPFDLKFLGDNVQRIGCGCNYHHECLLELFQVDDPQCVCGYNLANTPISLAALSLYLSPLFTRGDETNHRFSLYIQLPQRLDLLENGSDDILLEGAANITQIYQPKVDIYEYSPPGSFSTQMVVSVKAPQVYDLLVRQNQYQTQEFAQLLSNVAARHMLQSSTPESQFSEKLQEFANYLSGLLQPDDLSITELINCGLGITSNDSNPFTTEFPTLPSELVQSELSKFTHWNLLMAPPKHLLCFDYMDVLTTLGTQFDPVVAYLFANCIVFAYGHQVIGQVMISEIAAVSASGSQLMMSLASENLPELIFELHPVAVVKWDILLKRLVTNTAAKVHSNLVNGGDANIKEADEEEIEPLPIKQLTTNAWDFHPLVFDHWALPELEAFAEQVVGREVMRPEVLVEAVPAPDAVLLNLVLCLCVENLTGMTDTEYSTMLVRLIRELLAKLRQDDTLALVFVGGTNLIGAVGGSFIGLAPALWDGWSLIIDDIEVDNTCGISTQLEEYTAVFDKLHSLYPFIPDKINRTNKVLIVLGNDYQDGLEVKSEPAICDGLRRKLVALERLSISIIRIGSHDRTLAAMVNALGQPIEFMEAVRVTHGQHLLRFDDFEVFDYELRHLIDGYQKIVVPMVTLTFEPSALTEITSIEVGGKMQTNTLAVKVVVIVKDVLPGHERNFMMEMKLISAEVAPRLSYTIAWDLGREVCLFNSRGIDNRLREFIKRQAELQVFYWLSQVIVIHDSDARHEAIKLAVSQLYHLICQQWGYLRPKSLGDDNEEYSELASASLASLVHQNTLSIIALDDYFNDLLRELKLISAGYTHGDVKHGDARSCDIAYSLM